VDLSTADTLLSAALEHLQDSDPAMAAITMVSLGIAALYTGDTDRAVELCAASLSVCRAHGDQWLLANALVGGAMVDLARGKPVEANGHLHEALVLMRPFGNTLGVALALDLLAVAEADSGQYRRAALLMGAARSVRRSAGQVTFGTEHFRRRRDGVRAQICERLGPAEFDDAYRTGGQLSAAEAAGYLLGEAEPAQTLPAEATPLTPRELEVAGLVAQGMTNKQVADRLMVACRTAECHVENILRKLGFSSRVQIATWHQDLQRPDRSVDR
jgi:DNA-binding CsgD family transcriptional regulator